MKKILLLLTSLLAIIAIAGCAEEEDTTPVAAKTYEEKIKTTSVHDLSRNEAVLLTAQALYNVPSLSNDVQKRVMHFYKMLETGDFSVNGGNTQTGPQNQNGQGIGKIEDPAIASSVFQTLYARILIASVSNNPVTNQPMKVDNLKALMTYSIMDNTTAYNKARDNLTKNPDEIMLIQKFIKDYKDYIVPAQKQIVAVAKEYEKLLLDSSSSASKTAGGGGVVSVTEYSVSANIVYTFVELLLNSGIVINFDTNTQKDKILYTAELFYGLKDETKLKLTYDKDLSKFKVTDAISSIQKPEAQYLVKELLKNINETRQIPGGEPYPERYVMKIEQGITTPPISRPDSPLNPIKYLDGSADYTIITNVGDYLLASPTGKKYYVGNDYAPLKQTNNVTNNMALIYEKLKEYGLKSPEKISKEGVKALSEIISKYLRETGVSYYLANIGKYSVSSITEKDTTDKYTPDQLLSGFVAKFFAKDKTTGIIPACMLIEEYNKRLDAAAISYAGNKGYFATNAKSSYCQIYIDSDLRRDFLNNNSNKPK